MKKEPYEKTEMEIIGFFGEDIVMTSCSVFYEEDELPLMSVCDGDT